MKNALNSTLGQILSGKEITENELFQSRNRQIQLDTGEQ
jgi:hypothetical protein